MAISRNLKSVSIHIRAWHVSSLKWNCIANKNNLYSKKLRAYGLAVIKNKDCIPASVETIYKLLSDKKSKSFDQ